MDETEFYLEDLKSKFMKINPSDYYLSYSGGRDSHFLYWFIKEYLKEPRIEIVSLNTGMELEEIRKRMQNNADRILYPVMKPFDIKDEYGIPCVSKHQDELVYIYREQLKRGKITPCIEKLVVNSKVSNSFYKINNKLHDALFSGTLHKISHLCCKYLKKEPARNFEKESDKLPIMGIMWEESLTRKVRFTSCFNQKRYFYPIWDLTHELQRQIEDKYEIEVPSIYQYVTQTGCAGCPYGISHGETIKELSLCTPQQRKFVLDYFKESYEVRGLFYQYKFNF